MDVPPDRAIRVGIRVNGEKPAVFKRLDRAEYVEQRDFGKGAGRGDAACSPVDRDEAGRLQLPEDPPDHDGVRIDGTREEFARCTPLAQEFPYAGEHVNGDRKARCYLHEASGFRSGS